MSGAYIGKHRLASRGRLYRRGVAFVAMNDNPADDEGLDAVAGYMSVILLSEMYRVKAARVALDVLAMRTYRSCDALGRVL